MYTTTCTHSSVYVISVVQSVSGIVLERSSTHRTITQWVNAPDKDQVCKKI